MKTKQQLIKEGIYEAGFQEGKAEARKEELKFLKSCRKIRHYCDYVYISEHIEKRIKQLEKKWIKY